MRNGQVSSAGTNVFNRAFLPSRSSEVLAVPNRTTVATYEQKKVCRTRHQLAGYTPIVTAAANPTSGISDLEDNNTHCTQSYICSLFLAAALMASVSSMTAAAPQSASVQVRVYDRDHKDYHNWSGNEDRAYRGYLTERHISYRAYNKQNHKTQSQYWNWRHSHPDNR